MNTAIDPHIADITEMQLDSEGLHDLKIEYLYNQVFREFWNSSPSDVKALIVFLFEQREAYLGQSFSPHSNYGPVLSGYLSLTEYEAAERLEGMISEEIPYQMDWICHYVDFVRAAKDSAIQEIYFDRREYLIFDHDFFGPRRSRW